MDFTFCSVSFDTLSAGNGSEVVFCQLHTCQHFLALWQDGGGHTEEEKKGHSDTLTFGEIVENTASLSHDLFVVVCFVFS